MRGPPRAGLSRAHRKNAGRKQGDRNGEAVSSKHKKAQPDALRAHEQRTQSEEWLWVLQQDPGGVCEFQRIVPVKWPTPKSFWNVDLARG